MRIAIFSTKQYDRQFLNDANAQGGHNHELVFLEARLGPETAPLAAGFEAVCAFVNDRLNRKVLEILAAQGVQLIVLRSAGFNHVDLRAAADLGLRVARVPAYSPYAVAEHTLALIMALNRKTHRAYARVREGNFSLEGLLGFDLYKKTVGIVGTGKIGRVFAGIMIGLGCRVIAFDPQPNEESLRLGIEYVSFEELLAESDIISLHCPLNAHTHHLIDKAALQAMKPGVMLINTSRGAIIDTRAVIHGLKSGRIGYLGLDVYEEEEELFFEDLSGHVLQDDVFARLLTFSNVVITGHQGFFTREALGNIAQTTLENATAFATGTGTFHEVTL
ncbi:MAG: 2-hydroxyacid dehydrogenase [Bradymonadaceae bacterium]|nr:2-hydroxyacid dehydrogenase [Lujinxingiaceae bacterium]